MPGTLYLIRHGATDSNLAKPARLQGRSHNPPLAAIGRRQSELTRDLLAAWPIHACYSSPLLRAVETAAIIGRAHGLHPETIGDLVECDVGRWEGLDWESIRREDPESYERFMARPGTFGYPGGESFGDVQRRASACLTK